MTAEMKPLLSFILPRIERIALYIDDPEANLHQISTLPIDVGDLSAGRWIAESETLNPGTFHPGFFLRHILNFMLGLKVVPM